MITQNVSTLKIHKLTKEQYDRELAADRIDPNALYFTTTDEEGVDLSGYATKEELEVIGEISNLTKKLVPSFAAQHTAPNDLLNVYLNGDYTQDCMQPSQVATEDASTLVNSPLASGAFYAFRTVESYNVGHVCVRLHEMYPNNGRVWSNMYDKNQQNWMGWVSNVGGGSVDLSAYATKSELNAHYISTITTGSADDILIPLTLRDIRTDNDELRSAISGNGT
jgi:hypothetical protein